MFMNYSRVTNGFEKVEIYQLTDEVNDMSEYLYQKWYTEGYEKDVQYSEFITSASEWNPKFLEMLDNLDNGFYIEHTKFREE